MKEVTPPVTDISKIIDTINNGDLSALDSLFPIVYEELRRNAHFLRLRTNKQDTLNTTALVHEAYIKLSKADLSGLNDKNHFFRLASKAMRQILINACTNKNTEKRGGDSTHLKIHDLEEQIVFDNKISSEIICINEALKILEKKQPDHGKLVEYRFFSGLSIDDTAKVLNTSPSTVKRNWAMVKTWLYSQINTMNMQN